mmetsp:Transcript_8505/g.14316  ORF Transcript_8505/g.14316 Transcript_8505/m.14316 type:complete len:231 (-) Transcript_8505:35-727(-)
MVKVLVGIYSTTFLIQFFVASKRGQKYAIVLKLIGPIGTIMLNLYRDSHILGVTYGFLAMINYDLTFMAQGILDNVYEKEIAANFAQLGRTPLAPLFFFVFAFTAAMTEPVVYNAPGDLYFYPLYETFFLQCCFTIGSYFWVYFLSWLMKWIGNEKFGEKVYGFIGGSSLWAYCTHYLWIVLSSYYIIRPNNIPYTHAVVINFFVAEACIAISFLLSMLLFGLCRKKQAD